MKHNNRGFTLVEFLVAAAILGIITVAAGGFMVAGTKTYSSLSYTLRLQYESQLLMSQLEEYLVDCSAGAGWDNTDSPKHYLYVVNYDETDETEPFRKTVHVFVWNSDTKELFFKSVRAGAVINTADNLALMAEHVESLDVKFASNVSEAVVDMSMVRNGKSYQAQQVIALRNQPVVVNAGNWDALWTAIRNQEGT